MRGQPARPRQVVLHREALREPGAQVGATLDGGREQWVAGPVGLDDLDFGVVGPAEVPFDVTLIHGRAWRRGRRCGGRPVSGRRCWSVAHGTWCLIPIPLCAGASAGAIGIAKGAGKPTCIIHAKSAVFLG